METVATIGRIVLAGAMLAGLAWLLSRDVQLVEGDVRQAVKKDQPVSLWHLLGALVAAEDGGKAR